MISTENQKPGATRKLGGTRVGSVTGFNTIVIVKCIIDDLYIRGDSQA